MHAQVIEGHGTWGKPLCTGTAQCASTVSLHGDAATRRGGGWRTHHAGWTDTTGAGVYQGLLDAEIVPGIIDRKVPGLHGVEVLRRESSLDEVEFVTVMTFDDWAAVEAFAGTDRTGPRPWSRPPPARCCVASTPSPSTMNSSSATPDPVTAYRLLMADVYELAGLSRRTSETFAREVSGQSVARWHVMSVVSDEPATVPAIARRLGNRRQSVQHVVDALARMGHVAVKDNPAHRRSPLVTLTPAGETEPGSLNSTAETVRAAQLKAAGVGVADIASARETLRALIATLRADEPSKPLHASRRAPRGSAGRRRYRRPF